MHITHRIGTTPQQRGSLSGQTCPDVFALDTGDFAVMGTAIEEDLTALLPDGTTILPGERVVIVPAQLLTDAKPDIPTE